jgi:MraZ protein
MVSHQSPLLAGLRVDLRHDLHQALQGVDGAGGIGGAVALFIDTFVNRIDRKGRVSVPAAYRAALAGEAFQGIVAFRSFKYAAIHCAGMGWMQGLGANVSQADLFSDEHDDLTATLFADSKQLPFDGEGRILLPPAFAAHGGIGEAAAFVGRGPFFEIWEPAALERYKAEARQRALEKGRTLRQRPELSS